MLTICFYGIIFSQNHHTNDEPKLIGNIDLANDKKNEYQAIYASQTKGVFYMIYAKFVLDDSKQYIKEIELFAKNYSKVWTHVFSKQNIGFFSKKIDPSLFTFDSSQKKLTFKLPIKKRKGFKKAKVTFTNLKFKVKDLERFHILRKYVNQKSDISNLILSNSDKLIQQESDVCNKAFGTNCVESSLYFIK